MFFVAAERGLQKNRGHPVLSRRRTAVRVPVFQIPVFRAAALSHRLRHRFCTAGGHRVPAQPATKTFGVPSGFFNSVLPYIQL